MNNVLSCVLGGKAEFTIKHLPLQNTSTLFFPFCAAKTPTQKSFLMLLQFYIRLLFLSLLLPIRLPFCLLKGMHSAAFIVFS